MATHLLYPHITHLPDGTPVLERLPRIRLSQIVGPHLVHGWSADELCRQYDHLRISEVHSALAYYFDNPEVIDAEFQEELDQAERDRATGHQSPVARRLSALKHATVAVVRGKKRHTVLALE